MQKSDKVAIVLHGDLGKSDDLWTWTKEDDMVVAADGAADVLMSLGIRPALVIGDMDGILPQTLELLPETAVTKLLDQNSTDFQKALRHVHDNFYVKSLAVLSYEGTRVDHMLSALFTAAAYTDKMRLRFVGSDAQAIVLGPGEHLLDTRPDIRVSLLPLGTVTVETATGLTYNADGMTFSVGASDGISNVATGDRVGLNISAGSLVAFVERFEGEAHW